MSPWRALCRSGISDGQWPALGISLRDHGLGWKPGGPGTAHLPERAQVRRWGSRRPPARAAEPRVCSKVEAGRGRRAAARGSEGRGLDSRAPRRSSPGEAQKTRPGKPGAERSLRLPRKQGPSVTGGRGGGRATPAFSSALNACAAQAGTLQRLPLPPASQIGHPMEGTRLSPTAPVTRDPESGT